MLPQENFNPKSTIYCIPAMYLLLGKILCVQIAQWLPWKCDVLRTENTGFNLSFVMIKLKII